MLFFWGSFLAMMISPIRAPAKSQLLPHIDQLPMTANFHFSDIGNEWLL
jgi:hypothetical protein